MSSATASSRFDRNELVYRDVNERIAELNRELEKVAGIGGQWICECADTGCTSPISITVDEYEAVRENSRRFIVAPGHVGPCLEQVVRVDERYWVVEKLGAAADAAELHDPRGQEELRSVAAVS